MNWRFVRSTPNPWGQIPLSAGGHSVSPRVQEYMARVTEAAERRDCPSRRHHYVPRAYLRAWSPDTKRVRVLDTRNGTDQLQGRAATCVSRNFYRVTDRNQVEHNQVEAMLAVIDSDTAVLLDKLRRWKPGDDFAFDDLMALSIAAALQRTRTPQQRRWTETMSSWKTERAGQRAENFITDTHVDLLFRSRYEAADQFSVRQLELWDDPRGRFITCDQPILMSAEAAKPSMDSARYVWWPISPYRVLTFGRETTGQKLEHRIASAADIRSVRQQTIRGAESAIIALPGDTDLPAGKVLSRRPQLVVECEPVQSEQRQCRLAFGWGYAKATIDLACNPLCALRSSAHQ